MSDDIAIKAENLSKTYRLYDSNLDRLKESLHPLRRRYHRDFFALKDISFEIKMGSTVGIIGKNGSGKSTLLKLICGVLTPTHGIIDVKGRISALLELGSGFNPELTGIENVFFNGTLMGYSKEEMADRLDNILSFADIGGFVNQPVKTYSSGMFVRLAFAVAINVEPDILVVDEALAVGDVRFQRKCISKIEDFKSQNKLILFVSHSTAVMNSLCSEAILLDDGLLKCIDSPRVISKMYHELLFEEKLSNEITSPAQLVSASSDNESEKDHLGSINRLKIKGLVIRKLNMVEPPKSTQELRHGNGDAEIIDFGILDSNGKRTKSLISGGKCKLFFRSIFYKDVPKIFASFIIKDVQGIELFYTNTEILKTLVPSQKKGDVLEVSANIEVWLAQGHYFMSYVVLDRMTSEYLDRRLDALQFDVISNPINCGGYVNLSPLITATTLLSTNTDADVKIGNLYE